ncbi:hypothetical protein VTI74DRAFT_9403 [Chaetomium olivicolor]
MAPVIRIVVKRNALPGGFPGHPATSSPAMAGEPAVAALPVRPPRSKRGESAVLLQAVDIALQYFNSADVAASTLTTKARNWADRYFKGYPYAKKRPTALLQWFPDLFNLDVDGDIRLRRAVMPSPTPEPEGATPRELRRAERRAMNSETFPEFSEPTLASEVEIDEIVDLRMQQNDAKVKPTMRVDAAMLRNSGLLNTLPEFIGQLAKANLETETMLAKNPDAVRFELDEEEAASKPHVEMNLFGGLVETQRRRRRRRVVLPRDAPLTPLPDNEEEGSAHGGQSPGHEGADDEDSGNETDASTSTVASLRAKLKRKAAALSDSGSDGDSSADSPPNNIRLQYGSYPPLELKRWDMKRRKLVTYHNPAAQPEDSFEHEESLAVKHPQTSPSSSNDDEDNRPSSSHSTSSSSSGGPTRIIVLKKPSPRPSPSPDESSSSSSSTPERKKKVVVLRNPRVSPTSSSGEQSPPGSSPSPGKKILKLKVSPNRSPAAPEVVFRESSVSSSEGESGSGSGSSGGTRKVRLVIKGKGTGIAERKRLIEEVD